MRKAPFAAHFYPHQAPAVRDFAAESDGSNCSAYCSMVGEQAQRIRHGLHFLVLLRLVAGHPADIDRPFQGVDGLAAVEHAQQFPAKGLVEEVVGEEDRSQQLPELHERFVQRIPARG